MFVHPAKKIKQHAGQILIGAAAFAVVALFLTLVMPRAYRADAQVLIIPSSRYGVDPYTVVRSAERVGENLAQIVHTDDFYRKVLTQPQYQLDTSIFQQKSERKRRKVWEETVDAGVVYGTGVLTLAAFHEDQEQATLYAQAAANALVERGWEYVGKDVTMKVVNNAVVTNWPVRPNVLVNMVAAAIVGFFLMIGWTIVKK